MTSIARKGLGDMIPSFNHSGVLPPFVGQVHENHQRSPYPVAMVDVASRFAGTQPRRKIFHGFLRYREELRSLGLIRGFQWLDGSFVEDVETTRERPPGDIDLVTFARRPDGMEDDRWSRLVEGRLDLFHPFEAKRLYQCDAYFVELSLSQPEWLVKATSYWSGLFSHQRDTSLWKGMIQVDLADNDGISQLMSEASFDD